MQRPTSQPLTPEAAQYAASRKYHVQRMSPQTEINVIETTLTMAGYRCATTQDQILWHVFAATHAPVTESGVVPYHIRLAAYVRFREIHALNPGITAKELEPPLHQDVQSAGGSLNQHWTFLRYRISDWLRRMNSRKRGRPPANASTRVPPGVVPKQTRVLRSVMKDTSRCFTPPAFVPEGQASRASPPPHPGHRTPGSFAPPAPGVSNALPTYAQPSHTVQTAPDPLFTLLSVEAALFLAEHCGPQHWTTPGNTPPARGTSESIMQEANSAGHLCSFEQVLYVIDAREAESPLVCATDPESLTTRLIRYVYFRQLYAHFDQLGSNRSDKRPYKAQVLDRCARQLSNDRFPRADKELDAWSRSL